MTHPSPRRSRPRPHLRVEPGDPAALLAAIERARASEPDLVATARFAAANRWQAALEAELADLAELRRAAPQRSGDSEGRHHGSGHSGSGSFGRGPSERGHSGGTRRDGAGAP